MSDNHSQRDPRTHEIIGAAFEVHNQLGFGFLEAVYQQSLAIEFEERDIPFRREVQVPVQYKGRLLQCKYVPDFLCFDSVIVEIKAVAKTGPFDDAQLINYLRATGKEVGLLLNFGEQRLNYKRLILTNST